MASVFVLISLILKSISQRYVCVSVYVNRKSTSGQSILEQMLQMRFFIKLSRLDYYETFKYPPISITINKE